MTIKQPINIQVINTQEDVDFLFRRSSTKKRNLFQVDQLSDSQKVNPRKLMIQRLKSQALELKEMKKAISSASVSRLSQMKKIINQNVQLKGQQQSQYRFERLNSHNEKYRFTKSIKDLVRMGRLSKDSSDNNNNHEVQQHLHNRNTINPENSSFNNNHLSDKQKQQSNRIENSHDNNNNLKLQSSHQTPSLITTNIQDKFSTSKHLRQISSQQQNNFNTSQSKNNFRLIRTNSENRLRSSSTSNLYRHKYTDQMTLSIRKQIYQMQSKQKLLQNKIKLIENQTKHKLDKKIKQNAQLQQKHNGLYEIIHSRMQRQRQRTNLARKRIQQRRFIHQGKALKVSIQKLSKISQKRQQQQMIRNLQQESMLSLAYSRYLKEKQDLKKQQKLAFRLSFVKDFYNKDLVGSRIDWERKNNSQRSRSVSTQYL